MISNFKLRCSECGLEYPVGTYNCKKKDGVLEAIYFPAQVKKIDELKSNNLGIWRYEKLLPFVDDQVSFCEGSTPLIPSRNIGNEIGIDLFFKDETWNPTGSFKDRAATVMLSIEKKLGSKAVVTASSGNAAGAIALYSALAKIRCFIFMFHPTQEKLIHAMSYGSFVFNVVTQKEGEVLELAKKAAEEFGWSMLTTTADANPFTLEGYKTIAYELFEQTELPDSVIVPVGSGTLLVGIWKGFRELKNIGLINKVPKLIGVQPEGNNPIVQSYEKGGEEVKPISSSKTIAGGLSLENPGLSGKQTLKAVRETGGVMIDISDDQIMETLSWLPRKEGIYGEPSGVVSVAALPKAYKSGALKKGERVVCIITGSGFKDMTSANRCLAQPIEIEPNLTAVKGYLSK